MQQELGHFCGIAGIFSLDPINVPEQLFFPLFSIQHRGQESAGIAYRRGNETVVYKDLGMVSQVLSRYLDRDISSHLGIGHVRYSTHGGNKLENAQPIHVRSNKGEIALAHNGNISNSRAIQKELFDDGSIFQTSSDSELILHLISRSRRADFHGALVDTLERVEGAFSLVLMHNDTLMAVRDPSGFRPLFIGSKAGLTVVASESCALDILRISDYRELKPGELVRVDSRGQHCEMLSKQLPTRQCVFELIYFARPDSTVFETSVYSSRKRMGAELARADGTIGDVVIPVPDSGNSAALGYAEQAGIPFELGLTRNHYAGRSFILPTKAARKLAVRMKLHPIRNVISGKRVVLVDDSLVRGTTARILVALMKEAGAAEVHLRLSSPEIRWPCFFGIDIPTREELISNHMDAAEIARAIGADSVRFLSIEQLQRCLTHPSDYCFACFSGRYPFAVPLADAQLETAEAACETVRGGNIS